MPEGNEAGIRRVTVLRRKGERGKMRKIFYGGTFDPPHLGHIRLAEAVLKSGAGDEILLAPAWIPPHKQNAALASFEDRMEMLRLATEGMEHFSVSDVESRRGGVSYTIDTLHRLSAENPEDPFILLIGSDSLAQLYSWFRVGELVFEYEVLTYPRPGFDVTMEALLEHWSPEWAGKLYSGILRGLPEYEISSSEIRERLRKGEPMEGILNRKVWEYIKQRSLYEH